MSKQIAEGTALGARYEIFARTGTVDSSETRAETEVTGNVSGGGGVSGYSAPVSGRVQSKTTRYQNIYLTDDDGIEHNIELVNFLVPCKQGHKLTMLGIAPGGSDTGAYFRAYNHNTREHCNHPKGVISTMFPRKIFMGAMGLLALFLLVNVFTDSSVGTGEALFMTAMILVFSGLILAGIGWVFAYIRSIGVRSNSTLKNYVNSLGSA